MEGVGKLRHLRVSQLWVQEKAGSGELNYRKVKGTDNPADLMAKLFIGSDVKMYVAKIHLEGK